MEHKFIRSGIPGLDNILGGGFIENSIVTVSGPTGCGKSSLGMQFLYNGAVKSNEPGLFISIEESRQDLLFHMGGYGWDFTKIEKERKFVLLDYPLQEVDQIMNQYSAVQEIIQTTGARRVVIDSVMPIALHFSNDDERKRGFLKLMENIRRWNTTTLLISEDFKAQEGSTIPGTLYGIESFTDGWINFFYRYDEKNMERKRYIEVIKMKGINHSTKAYPVAINRDGLLIGDEDAQEMAVPPKKAIKYETTVTAAKTTKLQMPPEKKKLNNSLLQKKR